MKKSLLFLFILSFNINSVKAQEYVHQVLILNEGYFDYNLNQSIVPPTIGSYNPSTQTYINVDTLHSARFASDLVVYDDYFYVAADNMLYKYDLIVSQQVDGIRNLAVWDDKIIITRGDYDNTTWSPIFFNSYLQVYNISDLSLYVEIDTIVGPKWATQNLVVNGDKIYVAINNAYEWGNEKGLVGILDLNTFIYLDEIDLGLDGVNPDNMLKFGDYIYTINNKDWSGSSISQVSILSNSVSTINLAGAPTGCGTSCLRDGKINYQISGDSILNEWDVSLLPSSGSPLSINENFYDLSYDSVNNLLYASTTDYSTYGTINIYDYNNSLVSSFAAGISPGVIAFDVRSFTTHISLVNTDLLDKDSNKNYDMLGRIIDNDQCMQHGVFVKDNKLFFLVK